MVWPDECSFPIIYHLLGDEGHVHREAATNSRVAWIVGALRPSASCDPVGAPWLSLGAAGVGRLACVCDCERRGAALLGCRRHQPDACPNQVSSSKG